MGFKAYGSGFTVCGSGFRLLGLGLTVYGSEFRLRDLGLRVQGFGFLLGSAEFYVVSRCVESGVG